MNEIVFIASEMKIFNITKEKNSIKIQLIIDSFNLSISLLLSVHGVKDYKFPIETTTKNTTNTVHNFMNILKSLKKKLCQ